MNFGGWIRLYLVKPSPNEASTGPIVMNSSPANQGSKEPERGLVVPLARLDTPMAQLTQFVESAHELPDPLGWKTLSGVCMGCS